MHMSKKTIIKVVASIVAVVILVMGLCWFVRPPPPSKSSKPPPSASSVCIGHLREIDAAKQQWALENKKTANDVPTWDDIIPYLGRGAQIPRCPQGGTYKIGRVGDPPTCSIGGPGHSIP